MDVPTPLAYRLRPPTGRAPAAYQAAAALAVAHQEKYGLEAADVLAAAIAAASTPGATVQHVFQAAIDVVDELVYSTSGAL